MIGRHESCSFVLNDPSVSRQHALVWSETGTFTLMDYKSSNGVKVNGQPIFRHALAPGDAVEIGEVPCVFSIEAELEQHLRDELANYDGAFVDAPFRAVLERTLPLTRREDKRAFRFLLEAAAELAQAKSRRDVGIRALHAALTGLPADRAFLAVPSARSKLEILSSLGIAPERIETTPFYVSAVTRAMDRQVLLRTGESFADFVHHDPRVVIEDIGSVMVAPLTGARQALGALYVDRTLVEPPFQAGDEAPFAVLAQGVAAALEAAAWREEIEETLGAVQFLGQGTQSMGIVCGVCGEAALPGSREVVVCDGCNAIQHRDCWDYYGGCARYACGGKRHQSLSLMRPGFRPS